MSLYQRIYIIGFMGSGKTTAGRKLALLLGWSFTDLDSKIEEKTGLAIADIFSQYGENYFRDMESEVLRNLDHNMNSVVSTGGGTPCHGDNMDFMLESGLTVYLKLTPGQLKSRLEGCGGKRPLIKDLRDEDLFNFIETKLSGREKWYNRSEFIIDGFDLDINLLQNLVKKRLRV
jgi:shikimate kinase